VTDEPVLRQLSSMKVGIRRHTPATCTHRRASDGHVPLGVYLTGVHLKGVHLIDVSHGRVSLTGVHLTGVHLTGVYLMGLHLIGVYLMGVHLINVYFMDMYMFPNQKRLWGQPPSPPYEPWLICRDLSCKIRVFAVRDKGPYQPPHSGGLIQ
jgi:hypothetical protein